MNDIVSNKLIIINKLIYYLIKATAFFSDDYFLCAISISFWMGITTLLKFVTILYLLNTLLLKEINSKILVAISLCFINPIPLLTLFTATPLMKYSGYIRPTIWHNPTIIFVMPFAIMLFFITYSFIEKYSQRKLIYILLLVFINVILKPSYIFIFIPAYSIFVLSKRTLRNDIRYYYPIFLPIAMIILAYVQIYTNKNASVLYGEATHGISLAPFKLILHINNGKLLVFFLKLLLSNILPLYAICLIIKEKGYRNSISGMLKYAIVSYIVSLSIYILFIETGPREFHGNFSWQNVVAQLILIIVTYIEFEKLDLSSLKRKTFYVLLYSQTIWGIAYYLHYFK
ncbi:MAG: hypothetical protein K9J13_00475 [Saprospiraceae bacterium]|nr:hypothetical protein [Saprospiraceae bacterium]